MLTLNGIPFTTSRATYYDHHPQNVSGKSAIYVQVVLPIHDGTNFYAIVDTGAPYCIFKTEISEALGLSFDDGARIELHTAYGSFPGTIQRLMIDKLSGNVAYAVLSFGGFLGMGQKHLPIPWARLTYDRALGAYHLDLTEEELKRAPSFAAGEDFDWGDRSREIEIHNYYRVPPYWGAY